MIKEVYIMENTDKRIELIVKLKENGILLFKSLKTGHCYIAKFNFLHDEYVVYDFGKENFKSLIKDIKDDEFDLARDDEHKVLEGIPKEIIKHAISTQDKGLYE
jgi:hypothetical protein